MADHEFHSLAHELVGDGNAFLGVGAIVADRGRNLEFLAQDPATGIDIFDRLLDPVLELRTESCAPAGDRAGDREFDGIIAAASAACEGQGNAERQAKLEPMSHSAYL